MNRVVAINWKISLVFDFPRGIVFLPVDFPTVFPQLIISIRLDVRKSIFKLLRCELSLLIINIRQEHNLTCENSFSGGECRKIWWRVLKIGLER